LRGHASNPDIGVGDLLGREEGDRREVNRWDVFNLTKERIFD